MQWFRKHILRQTSILLTYDFLSQEIGDFVSQINEVAKFFNFSTVSKLCSNGKTVFGKAALVFLNPRKAWLLHVYPLLREREIPFTVMLNPKCVGLNRLPLEEEFSFYSQFGEVTPYDFENMVWEHPQNAEKLLDQIRKKHGPLPLNKINPLQFFATWGELLEIPPSQVEWGFHFTSSPQTTPKKEISFVEQRIRQIVRVGYVRKTMPPQLIQEIGLILVGPETGELKSEAIPLMLPIWKL